MTDTIQTSPEQLIETGLKKFEESEITPNGLIKLSDSVKDLVIKDVNDKDGAKAVEEARKMLKKKRIEIKKTADDIRETAKRFNQAVISREKMLIGFIEPTEAILAQREDTYNQEVERIRAEEERNKAEKINNRIKVLNDYHYAVDIQIITSMSDEKFEDVLTEAKTEFDKSEKIRREEEQKEELRLAKEREEIERQKRTNERIGKIVSLGFVWNEKYKSYGFELGTLSGIIGYEQIDTYPDEQFEKFYSFL